MKSLWKCFSFLSILALLLAACAQVTPPPPEVIRETVIVPQEVKQTVVVKEIVEVPAPTQPPAPIAPASAPDSPVNPVLTAVKVAEITPISADWAPPAADNPIWKDAPVSQIGGMQWKAIYTDKDVAFLLTWIDRDMSVNANGNYIWDPGTNSWSYIEGNQGKQEWMNLAWDINSVVLGEGCSAFCHEDPPGSGLFHHQTANVGESADSWMLFGKHGWSFKYVKGIGGVESEDAYGFKSGAEDKGWIMGNIVAKQNGPFVFETTGADPWNVLAGDATFIDYAEDNIIVAPGDPLDANRDRPRDLYCQNCHVRVNLPYDPLDYDLTLPDDGEIKYHGNWDVPYTAPAYVETNPIDFVDAMVLTQAEVDSGEAVLVADLSPQLISEYWANYAAVNGLVPPLVLKEADGSMADVMVASNWKNGVWTMEIHRALITPHGADDVQFDDFTQDYHFSLTISNSGLLLGPQLGKYGGILTFKQ